MLHPRKVGITRRGNTIYPTGVFLTACPILDIEWGIGQHIIHGDVGVNIAGESVSPAFTQALRVEGVDSQIHFCHPPGALVEFLAVDCNSGGVMRGGFQEFLRLDEHAARTTTRIVNPAFGGFQDLNQSTHYGAWGVEFAATLPLGAGEFF